MTSPDQPFSINLRRGVALATMGTITALAAACGPAETPQPEPSQPTTPSSAPDMPSVDTAKAVDLRDGLKFMKGVSGTAVTHTGEKVLSFPDDEQPSPENSEYLDNPSVNTYGTHIVAEKPGYIAISTQLVKIDGRATFSAYGAVPVWHDEDLTRSNVVDVSVEGSTATISVKGDAYDEPVPQSIDLGAPAQTAEIMIAQNDTGVKVSVNGKMVASDAKPFNTEAWIGLDAAKSFEFANLQAYPIGDNTIAAVDMSTATFDGAKRSPKGLAGLAKKNGHGDIQVGTAVHLPALMSDPEYAKFVIENANEIETEMSAKPQALQPEKGNWQWGELDATIDFAEKHNLTVHLHTPIFNEANPLWLTDELANAKSAAEVDALMKSVVQEPILHVKDKKAVQYMDVVNEPFDPDEWGELNQNNPWYVAYERINPGSGADYIAKALKYAHQANPSLKLGINEWGIDTDDDRANGVLKLVKRLKKQGVPLDFIGIQAHYFEDDLDDDDIMDRLYSGKLSDTFKQFKKLGVDVRLSEVSVAENDDDETKADVYQMLLESCLKASNCIGFNAWGWTNSDKGFYFTYDVDDPGDDAPTTQEGNNPVKFGRAWKAMLDTVRNR